MEERDLNSVERELRTYLSSQLDRVPVRSTPRFARPARSWIRTAALVPATMLIILIAVGAGLGLADWRARQTPSDESQVARGGVPGPLALAGGAPSLGFGLVSTSANMLLVRNETTTAAPMTVTNALPQVAVSPNGHEIAYWITLPDAQTGKPSIYQLSRADLIVNGTAPAIGSPDGALMRAPTGEVPGPVIWSSDGTGLIANTHTPARRGPVVGQAPVVVQSRWFAIDVATAKATELPPGFEGVVSAVYAWDRQRDLITGSGLYAGDTTFTTLSGGQITNTAIPPGSLVAAADTYGRSAVLVSAGDCAGRSRDDARCPILEIRDQATFAKVATVPTSEPTTGSLDIRFRPRSQDLIVQISLPTGEARVELWSDLGRGGHSVLASYTPNGGFTAPREAILPRVDGSAVFLLKFDDSAGGRWFGELVGLAPNAGTGGGQDRQRTPFEIRTGGNPLASVVLDPVFARAMEPGRPSMSPHPSAGSSAAREAILQRFSRTSSEIRRIDRIDAKRMTRGEFEQASNNSGTSTSPYTDPHQVIWVVAISGEVVPQFGRGLVFTWGIYLVSADNGDTLGMLAGGDAWPPYFDGLPNRDALMGPTSSPAVVGDSTAANMCERKLGSARLVGAFTSTAGAVADWTENTNYPDAPRATSPWRALPPSAMAYVCYFDGQFAITRPPPPPGSTEPPMADRAVILIDANGAQVPPGKSGPSQSIPLLPPGGRF